MRFVEHALSIPDELLHARDEGRVVFFCGAGVSRARAEMPDFCGLAKTVLSELGETEDSESRKVLNRLIDPGDDMVVLGLNSVDRVFGLLERTFDVKAIHAAVAKALTPKKTVDLSAHKILLRLATTPQSKVQLVTTNFDRLFEECYHDLTVHEPPRLPKPSRYDDLDGIVYLHGRVNESYTGASGTGFILSGSDFGHAYLSEGWATEFFREIVRGYIVVFVGYSADDPPIHYLLEGLHRNSESSNRLFSFQAEDSEESIGRWRHKGVDAIGYSPLNGHRALWDTLEEWAVRADGPGAWRQSILKLALAGPQTLQPHQRGQVAHIVSTNEGAREFAQHVPPAEWLCVFDSSLRHASLNQSSFDLDKAVADPFTLYGIDSDPPHQRWSDSQSESQVHSSGLWDAFSLTDLDRQSFSDEDFPSIRGGRSREILPLPKRLACLVSWVGRVANSTTTVWWAARQVSVHSQVCHHVRWSLEHEPGKFTEVTTTAWKYLLEAWKVPQQMHESDLYRLKREIDRQGWNSWTLREFVSVVRPFVTASSANMGQATPPAQKDSELKVRDLIRLEVCYPKLGDIPIPDEWLERAISGLRANLEIAVQLSDEIDDMRRFLVCPFEPDPSPDISRHARTDGVSGYVLRFADLFGRLARLDKKKAKRELLAWPTNDDSIFSRLRIWAAGNHKLVTPHAFATTVLELSDEAFWNGYHQRDLLLALAERWQEIPEKSRKRIEKRLLNGPVRTQHEDEATYKNFAVWETLDRLQWLADRGCTFTFDLAEEIAKRQSLCPEWRPSFANKAADSREIRGGWIRTNTEHSALTRAPIETVLDKARELSGRSDRNVLEDCDPFTGLCAERPVRAYLALAHAARLQKYPAWAWRAFLGSGIRQQDQPKMSAAIAERSLRFPPGTFLQLLHEVTTWLRGASESITREYPESFDKLITRIIDVLEQNPSEGQSAVTGTGNGREWSLQAINSLPGHATIAILEDSRIESFRDKSDLPAHVLSQLARLLSLSGDARRYAIVILSRQLRWMHQRVAVWTERNLLSILATPRSEDRDAFWGGFLQNPSVDRDLFLRLKPGLIEIIKDKEKQDEDHLQSLAGLLTLGWNNSSKNEEQLVSNVEFRELLLRGREGFRFHVLWHFGSRIDHQDETVRKEWLGRAKEFFYTVWPRQKSVKSPAMTGQLCELLLLNSDCLSELAPAVLPFLTKITRGSTFDLYLPSIAGIVALHGEILLEVLHTVLSSSVVDWPYGAADVLDRIGESNADLLSDTRLQRLKNV